MIGVLSDRERRIRRVMQRDGIDAARAAARIDAQKGEEYFKANCDHILYNNGDEAPFIETCREFFTEVLKNHG